MYFSKKVFSKSIDGSALKKYTNWDKLSCLSLNIFLSFWGNEGDKNQIFRTLFLGPLQEKNIYEEDLGSLFMLFFASSFSIEGSLDFFSS